MILYEVILDVDSSLAERVDHHMRQHHIPHIFATGCFRSIRFQRAFDTRFRTSYEAETPAELDRYLQDHAPALRAEFQAEFPTGVRLSRETWRVLESWG